MRTQQGWGLPSFVRPPTSGRGLPGAARSRFKSRLEFAVAASAEPRRPDPPAAADLKVPESRVRRWVKERRLPVYKPAGRTSRTLIDRADLDKFMAAIYQPAEVGPLAE